MELEELLYGANPENRNDEWMGFATPEEIAESSNVDREDAIEEYLGYTGGDQSIEPFFEPDRANEYLGHVSTFDPATGTGVFPFEMTGAPRQTASFLSGLGSLLKQLQGKPEIPGQKGGTDYLKYILAAILANKARKEAKATRVEKGGGTTIMPTSARDTGRYLTTGPTGQPIFAYKYAKGGAVKPAYVDGKPLVMQDGGFVFTGDATNEAARRYGGIQSLIPEAKMISAPGGPKDDLGSTVIVGKRGNLTPARVSGGESYVPPGYDTRKLHALMKSLERTAR